MRSRPQFTPMYLAATTGVAFCYLAAARLGLTFAIPPGNATAVWPPSGIALAALLILGYRTWPGVWVGATIVNAATGVSAATAAALGTGNTIEAVVAAWLLRRYLRIDAAFTKLRDALIFTGVAAVSCTIASLVGASSLFLGGYLDWSHFLENWWTWWVGDVAGQVIVTPLVLALWSKKWSAGDRRQRVELAAVFVLLAGCSFCVFGGGLPERFAASLVYVTLIPLIWVAFRFDLVEVTGATALISIAAIWGACNQVGAFGSKGIHPSLANVQIFMNIYAVTGLAMAGVVAGRRAAESALRESRDRLYQEYQQRVRTEQAFKKSETTFEAVFTSAPIMMLLLDQDRTVRAANPAAQQLITLPDQEGGCTRFGSAIHCVHSGDSPNGCGFGPECAYCPIRRIIEETFQTGVAHRGHELRFTRRLKDEQCESYFLVSTSMVCVPGGREVLVIIEDISDRKHAEEQIQVNLKVQETVSAILRSSLQANRLDEFLRQALDLIVSVPWMRLQPKGCIFLADGKSQQLVMKVQQGLPPEQLAACHQVSFGHCLCGAAVDSREIVFSTEVDEHHATTYPGMPAHGHYCVPIVADRNPLGVLNLFVEEGHRRRPEEEVFLGSVAQILATTIRRMHIQEALYESDERFHLAIRGTDAGIWDWDLRTNEVYFSPRWKSILGYTEDEVRHEFEEWESRLHPEDRERALMTVRDYLGGKLPQYELEHRLLHKDGSYRWILARGAVVCDDSGKPYRMAGSHLDITERKSMEETLRVQLAQLIAAQEIQSHLQPNAPPEIPGFDVAGKCYPAEFAAGDYFDFLFPRNGAVASVIGDVSGHGVGPAILMASLRAHLRSSLEAQTDMCRLLTGINQILREEAPAQFVTLLAVMIDTQMRTLTYVRCGHPPGFIMNARGEVTAWMERGGFPLGILPDAELCQSDPLRLQSGDVVVMLTDGILEAFSADDIQYGVDRTVQTVRNHRGESATQIIESLRKGVEGFAGRTHLSDDVTLIVIKVD